MADKKKMSVAEILAAARKMDSAGEPAAATASQESAADASRQEAAPEEKEPAQEPAAASKPSGKAAANKGGSGGRPSTADILAMARAEKQKGTAEKKEPAKPAAKKAQAKPAASSKTPASTSPKPAAKAPAAKGAPRGPLDTASILAAARKADKAGPMSKSEAAKLKSPEPPEPPAKRKVEVPPMPVKPAYAQRPSPTAKPSKKPSKSAAPPEGDRRAFLVLGFVGLAGVAAIWSLLTARFMYPNVLREPPSRFKVGFPGDFAPGTVETKFKAQYGVWVVNTEYNGVPQLFALKSVCTHLGCTPNWLEAEQKFKCPCHGSGFYKDGINFEGPAPRPLERYAIAIADDGQVEIDKSRTFQEEMGAWSEPASFIPA